MASHPTPDFAGLLASLARELESRKLPFMIIGGHAVILHGQPRLTEDIDVTLGVDADALGELLLACEALGLSPLPDDVEPFVKSTFVLPAEHTDTGVRVDFIFSTTPYERQAIERAVRVQIGGESVPYATAEDLIIHKLFAGRPRDIEDAASVVRRQGKGLDWDYILEWAAQFSEVPGREDLPRQVARLREEAARP